MIFISNRNGSLEFVNRVQPSYTAPCENSIKVVPKYKRNTDVPGFWFKNCAIIALSISTKANTLEITTCSPDQDLSPPYREDSTM